MAMELHIPQKQGISIPTEWIGSLTVRSTVIHGGFKRKRAHIRSWYVHTHLLILQHSCH